jgi:hypothetical protein
VRTRCTVPVLAVLLRLLKRLRNQIDRSALEIFAEVLVPSQFPALVPRQQADDIVRYAGRRKGRRCEVAEIVSPQLLDAGSLGDPPESLS